jgi:hypothetical protein
MRHLVSVYESNPEQFIATNSLAGVSIRNAKKMLKLVYAGFNHRKLIKAIDFVRVIDSRQQAQAYNELYKDIKVKKHFEEPEMLLLQKRIRELEAPGTVLNKTKTLVDAHCKTIISSIVQGIEKRDYSISRYIAKKLKNELFEENIGTIVETFYNGTLDNILLLIQYSMKLPFIQNCCICIITVFKELEKRNLLDTDQGMHLWAYAKFVKEKTGNWTSMNPNAQKFCTDAIDKLSLHKEKFFGYYQECVENSEMHKIRDLHGSNLPLMAMVRDFVSFYYNGEVGRTQNLLKTSFSIPNYDTVGRILSQLHEEIAKNNQLNSFEAFRLFNAVKREMSSTNFNILPADLKKLYKWLKEKAPPCVRQLLWLENNDAAEFQLVNKSVNATLSVQIDKYNVICFALGDKRSNLQTWKITVNQDTSMLTLLHKKNGLELGTGNRFSPCLVHIKEEWMVKAVDENHLKIYAEGKYYYNFFNIYFNRLNYD